jgi:hypothetical protein
MRAVLIAHDLDAALSARDWLSEVARVLLRANKPEVLVLPDVLDRSHYRKLRQLGHRVPCAYTLLETALCVARAGAVDGGTNPDAAVAAVREVARDLPADLLKALAEMDVARLGAMVTFLERWFDVAKRDAGTNVERLVSSEFYPVMFEEQALLRTALEARIVADLFVERSEDLTKLRARIESLRDRAHDELEGALKQRSEAAWAAVLG